MTTETGFWTATRDHDKTPFFLTVANGDALFTSAEEDAFQCTDENDAEQLCEALEDTSPDGWTTHWVDTAIATRGNNQ